MCPSTKCSKLECEQYRKLMKLFYCQKVHENKLRISCWDWRTLNTQEKKAEFSSLITNRHQEPKMRRQLCQPQPHFLSFYLKDKMCPPQNPGHSSLQYAFQSQCHRGMASHQENTHSVYQHHTHLAFPLLSMMKIKCQLFKRA